MSRRTSSLRVRLDCLPSPHLIPTLFNGGGFGRPLPFTATSTWTWIDHPVSGLRHRNLALLRLGFPSAPHRQCLTSPDDATRRTVLQIVRGCIPEILPQLVNTGFQVLFHSPPGVLFTFPSQYYARSVTKEYLALEGGPSDFPQGSSCLATLFNGGGFGRPLPFTATSTWTWIDHPVSGLRHRNLALLRLGFPSAPHRQCLTSPDDATRRTVLQIVRGCIPEILPQLVNTGFQVLFHSPPGVLFTFPSQYYARSVTKEYLALEGGPSDFPQGSSCLVVLWILPLPIAFMYGAFTLSGRSLSVTKEYLALEGGPSDFPQGSSCLVVLWILPLPIAFMYGAFTLSGRSFQDRSINKSAHFCSP